MSVSNAVSCSFAVAYMLLLMQTAHLHEGNAAAVQVGH